MISLVNNVVAIAGHVILMLLTNASLHAIQPHILSTTHAVNVHYLASNAFPLKLVSHAQKAMFLETVPAQNHAKVVVTNAIRLHHKHV